MKKDKQKTKQVATPQFMECCQMRAVISVDKRGQVILPKKLRDDIGIKPGDKLAVMLLGIKKTYSLLLTKVDDVGDMVMVKIVSGLDEFKSTVKE